MGKGKRADVYLEVRKGGGIHFFNETSACGLGAVYGQQTILEKVIKKKN